MPRFVDVTSEAGIDAVHDRGPDPANLTVMYGGGSVGDFNRDGWPDIFQLAGGTEPDRLYINNGDGTFTESAEIWGCDRTHAGGGAIVGDYDNDGYPDIFVTSIGPDPRLMQTGHHILYRNVGGRSFVDVAEQAGVKTTGVPDGFGSAFGDYDLDGDLDLFVTSWQFEIGGNTLFRNNGDGTFTDVTELVIDDSLIDVRGFTPCFADMNGDRYPELLISADFSSATYLVNNGDGTFHRLTRAEAGLDADHNGMGAVVADLNQDGTLDWFISNIYQDVGPYAGFGQALYIQQTQGDIFVDTARESGVEGGYWGWGTDAVDLNLDGVVDLVEVNGWPTGGFLSDPARMWLCLGVGQYLEVSESAGFVDTHMGRGLASLDYDKDGDIDLAIFNNDGPLRLFRNDTERRGNRFIRVVLDTSHRPDLAPQGTGSRIDVLTDGVWQRRYVDGGPTYLTRSELTEHFGIGDRESADRIRVTWGDGVVTDFDGMKGDSFYVLKAPPSCAYPDLDGDGEPDFGDFDPTGDQASDLEDLYVAFAYDVDHDGVIGVQDDTCMRERLRSGEIARTIPAR